MTQEEEFEMDHLDLSPNDELQEDQHSHYVKP